MTWRPVLNLKPSAERFEQRINVKMIILRIIKAVLNSKIIYSFELINHELLSEIISLSMFLLRRAESLLAAEPAKSFFFFLNAREYVLVFLQMGHLNFKKM